MAPSIAETYEELRQQWWGIPKSIDCWAEITHADGYDVELRPEPFLGAERLYYVNLGGYDPSEFIEKHKNVFVVAESVPQAQARAIKAVKGCAQPHRDEMYEAEKAFCLHESVRERQLYIHLTRAVEAREVRFTCEYKPIRK